MKTFFLLLIAFIPVLSFAQAFDRLPKDENGKIYYSEVIHVDSVNKNQLYLNSKKLFVDALKSNIETIQMDDKEAAIIIAKCFYDIYGLTQTGLANLNELDRVAQMVYTLKIQCKEGRYKYEIYNISFANTNMKIPKMTPAEDYFDKGQESKFRGPKYDRIICKNAMEEYIQSLVVLIKSSMYRSGLHNDNKDNW